MDDSPLPEKFIIIQLTRMRRRRIDRCFSLFLLVCRFFNAVYAKRDSVKQRIIIQEWWYSLD